MTVGPVEEGALVNGAPSVVVVIVVVPALVVPVPVVGVVVAVVFAVVAGGQLALVFDLRSEMLRWKGVSFLSRHSNCRKRKNEKESGTNPSFVCSHHRSIE